ncbi:MAG: hypothetical protein OXC93_01815 [Rhodospirillaceae bacterium]|nr:hypothetical protein [Rhodospirillaceae bacterium]
MIARHRKRHWRKPKTKWLKNALWYFLAALVIVILVGMAALWFQNRSEGTGENLCPAKSGPAAGLAVLLDLTDPLENVQIERLRGILDRRIAEAVPNTLIAVGAVHADTGARGADFALCKPESGERANEIYENPRMIAERYRKKFRLPFDKILERMLRSPKADSSPIMESLQALLVGTSGFVDAKYPRRVIIVSDLLQHSAAFSFYRRDRWATFVRSPNAQRLAGRLNGVVVEICRVPRPNARIKKAEVDDFWVNYFERAGASRVFASTCPLGDL